MNAQHHAAPIQSDERYRALLAVAQAITLHRDLAALFHELSDRLHDVVRFDCLGMVLHDAANDTVRIHILEPAEPFLSAGPANLLAADQTPAGEVFKTQRAMVISSPAEYSRRPAIVKETLEYGLQSSCELPLTTARRRIGTLIFASKQPAAFQEADVFFLQLVANQVAVAVENALAFQEIEALKDKLAKEKAYLEDEVRTEHNFGDIVHRRSGRSSRYVRPFRLFQYIAKRLALAGIVSLGDLAVRNRDDRLSGKVLERVSKPSEPKA